MNISIHGDEDACSRTLCLRQCMVLAQPLSSRVQVPACQPHLAPPREILRGHFSLAAPTLFLLPNTQNSGTFLGKTSLLHLDLVWSREKMAGGSRHERLSFSEDSSTYPLKRNHMTTNSVSIDRSSTCESPAAEIQSQEGREDDAEQSPSNHLYDVFNAAQKEFLGSVPAKERSQFSHCNTANELWERVRKFNLSGGRSKWYKPLTRIKRFSDALDPYFAAVTSISQGSPFASIAWGSILLVLKLASNFEAFFEKLANILDQLAQQMPRYDALMKLWEKVGVQPSPRLRSSLCNIYVELFRFLRSLMGIFITSDNKNRHPLRIMSSLSWRPFETRYRDFLDTMSFCREDIHDELQLAIYKEVLEMADGQKLALQMKLNKYEIDDLSMARKRYEEVCRTTTENHKTSLNQTFGVAQIIDRVTNWLSPPEFKTNFERALESKVDGTTRWLFDSPSFRNWQALDPSNMSNRGGGFDEQVLWIYGNPGCGKTVLAASSVENLRSSGMPVHYFFFRWDRAESNDDIQAWRALLAQLFDSLKHEQSILDKFSFVMSETSQGQRLASRSDLANLLGVCLHHPTPTETYIVLDGIDECIESDHFIEALYRAVYCGTRRSVRAKLLLFSRPNMDCLLDLILPSQQCSIGRETSKDIRLYLSRELERLKLKGRLMQDVNIADLLSRLVMGADGMFQWARLMMEYLNNARSLTPARREKVIRDVKCPERLDAMYTRILSQISESYENDKKLARFVILWLSYGKNPLTTLEMKDAVMFWSKESDFPNFERSVLGSCVCLVEVFDLPYHRFEYSPKGFRLIHKSVEDFIENLPTAYNPLYVPRVDAEFEIIKFCLEYLTGRLPSQPLIESEVNGTVLAGAYKRLPFCNYALTRWVEHLRRVRVTPPNLEDSGIFVFQEEKGRQLCDLLSGFLSRRSILIAWIEAIFLFQKSLIHEPLRKWCEIHINSYESSALTSQQHLFMEILAFCDELKQLHRDWGSTLAKSPSSIWVEPTAFGSYPHLKQTKMEFTPIASYGDSIPDTQDQTQHLSRLSVTSSNGHYEAILTLIPSDAFVNYNQNCTFNDPPSSRYTQLKHACSQWIAHYEVFAAHGSQRLVTKITIPLDEDEIWMNMQQSLWFGPSQTISMTATYAFGSFCQMQFPTAISPTLNAFTILRTVYTIPQGQSVLDKRYSLSQITFGFNNEIKRQWNLNYHTARLSRRLATPLWQCNPDDILSRACLYVYFFTFSPDGKYLFFWDEDAAAPSNLILFHLQDSDLGSWSMVRARRKTLPRSREISAAFHHKHQLVTICLVDRIYLWPFKSKRPELFPLWKEGTYRNFKSVGFSECGRYLIIHKRETAHPQILQIPDTMIRLISEGADDSSPKSEQNTALSDSHAKAGPLTLTNFALPPGTMVPSSFSRVSNDGAARGIRVLQTKNSVALQLWEDSPQQGGLREAQTELTKLPNWACMESASASIAIPKIDDEKATLVFNIQPKLWNSPTPLETRLPAIAQRDISSIKRPTDQYLKATPSGRLMPDVRSLNHERSSPRYFAPRASSRKLSQE
ncbi:hypothetical protein K469DRAFT_685203 [Zopfia rhizophila CBS 207.26]|uniref:Uncharacterized protein n=1 Tax=Zopfia rhizophila CBS 207.26 TaxID=1314779 RepID=A0A6A6D8R1_9PEZI|nr:hypothetical protein K469DRAFT_685203 [Zopfia rhizophila CBS 207.26]